MGRPQLAQTRENVTSIRLTNTERQEMEDVSASLGFIYGHIHSWKFDGYPPLDRLHKIQYTPGKQNSAHCTL